MSRQLPKTPVFLELLLWYLGLGCVTNHCTFVTDVFVNSSFGSRGHLCVMFWFLWVDIILFQAIFVSTDKQDLSSTTDVPVPQFGFTHSVSSPSLEFLAVLNTLTLNSQHRQIVHHFLFFCHYHQGSTAFWTIFHLPQSFGRKRAGSMKVKHRAASCTERLVKTNYCALPASSSLSHVF